MDIKKILHIIAAECKNGCTDYSNTMIYFGTRFQGKCNMGLVSDVASIINFNDLRMVNNRIFDATDTRI